MIVGGGGERSRIRTSGNSVVQLTTGEIRSNEAVTGGGTRSELLEYLATKEQILSRLPMPTGTSCKPKPGGASTEFLLTMPKIEFFDVSVQPTADTAITLDETGALILTSNKASLDGSPQVRQLGLNDRYASEVHIRVAPAANGGRLDATAQLDIDVDLPMPFSLMPREVSAKTGSTVISTMMQLLMREFVKNLARDFTQWRRRRPLPKA